MENHVPNSKTPTFCNIFPWGGPKIIIKHVPHLFPRFPPEMVEPVANSAGIPGSQHHFEMAEIAGTVAAHLQLQRQRQRLFLKFLNTK